MFLVKFSARNVRSPCAQVGPEVVQGPTMLNQVALPKEEVQVLQSLPKEEVQVLQSLPKEEVQVLLRPNLMQPQPLRRKVVGVAGAGNPEKASPM